MNFNMTLPGLKGTKITAVEERESGMVIHLEMPRKPHTCPSCGQLTEKIHDYRLQKVKHLKWFERPTFLFYKRRRYVCACGKRFAEKAPFLERYQRFSKEGNQALRIRAIKAKTFKEAAEVMGTSTTTVMRRFKEVAAKELVAGVKLPKAIAIDEYKGDTDAGKFQLIIANAETREPIDILPDRRKETIKDYLKQYGQAVEVVVMDMSSSFRAAVREALGKPVIIADRFHFSRYIYWALDHVRREVQKGWHAYDRKKCKKMRHVFFKRPNKLTESNQFYLKRYVEMSPLLKEAYELKNVYCEWFDAAKEETDIMKVKEGLEAFYRTVEASNLPAFQKAIQTFRNWQVEILNSFVFGYSNGFLEGINNKTKVMKRNAYGYKRFDHFKAKILLNLKYKDVGSNVG